MSPPGPTKPYSLYADLTCEMVPLRQQRISQTCIDDSTWMYLNPRCGHWVTHGVRLGCVVTESVTLRPGHWGCKLSVSEMWSLVLCAVWLWSVTTEIVRWWYLTLRLWGMIADSVGLCTVVSNSALSTLQFCLHCVANARESDYLNVFPHNSANPKPWAMLYLPVEKSRTLVCSLIFLP
jgi:hypothetical protein